MADIPLEMDDFTVNDVLLNLNVTVSEASSNDDGVVVLNVSGPSGTMSGNLLPATIILNKETSKWDPLSADRSKETISPQCLHRIKRDIMITYNDPPPGIYIMPDECDTTLIHALLTGPFDTPYEGGLFYFVLRCPSDYPIRPPMVKLMTTGEGKVRFNPNLYKNGKVCLSILGTWSGPSWSPVQTLSSVLLSIQSLMNEKPYFNEPGFDTEVTPGASMCYNKVILHETLRVAVCDMIERTTCDSRNCPQALREIMEKSFLEYYDYYASTCNSYLHLTKEVMQDPFGDNQGFFDFAGLLQRIKNIKEKLDASLGHQLTDAQEEDSHSEESEDSS